MKMNSMMPVPHSPTGKHSGMKLRGERPSMVKPTSMDHSAVTEANLPMLKSGGKMPAKTEMMTPMSHFQPTPHSAPAAPGQVKKWHKQGRYSMKTQDMESPSSEHRNGGSSLS